MVISLKPHVPALGFAVGLPWEFQISAFLPYVFNQGTAGNPSSQGFGDAGVLLSKELLLEGDWVPNLVASVGWTSPTSFGNSFTPLPYVSGFQGGFTTSKRFDPLVVFLSGLISRRHHVNSPEQRSSLQMW